VTLAEQAAALGPTTAGKPHARMAAPDSKATRQPSTSPQRSVGWALAVADGRPEDDVRLIATVHVASALCWPGEPHWAAG